MATRGSRRRSRALTAPGIDPIHTCPSENSTSVPLIRGEPSLRSVASVRCLRDAIKARTRDAKSGSAASNWSHDAMHGLGYLRHGDRPHPKDLVDAHQRQAEAHEGRQPRTHRRAFDHDWLDKVVVGCSVEDHTVAGG